MRRHRDDVWLDVAHAVSKRSTCTRKQVGCVVTSWGRVVMTGYNGSPSKQPHCTEAGCLTTGPGGGCERAVHAEAAVISHASRVGTALEGGTMYLTLSPCTSCAKLIINAGIRRVVFTERYATAADGVELLMRAGVAVDDLSPT
jgi:dCMP deaminase